MSQPLRLRGKSGEIGAKALYHCTEEVGKETSCSFAIQTFQVMSSASDDMLELRGEEIEALHSISSILQCGLNKRTLAVLLELIEAGVHPEALADLVLEMRAEAQMRDISKVSEK